MRAGADPGTPGARRPGPRDGGAAGRWRPLGLSLAVHAALLAAVVLGWWLVKRQPSPPTPLAIEAVVVDSRALGGTAAPAREPAPPRPVTPTEAAKPTEPVPPRREPERPAEQKRAEERKDRADKAEARAAADRKAAAAKEAAEKAASEKAAAIKIAERAAAEKAAAEKAAAEKLAARKAADAAQAERKAAEARAQREREAEEARVRAEREADLRAQLESEERAAAALASGLGAQWAAAIQAKIQRAWIRPASARAGLDCTVALTQVPGGEVVSVRILSCNGDAATRESIEAAVYRASPLPAPPDPVLFERNIEVRFRPND